MTEDQFKEYGKLKEELKKIETNIEYLNAPYENKLIIEDNTARLLLAYGNGMWNKTICDDNEILREVYDLLIMRLNIKKVNIIQKMKEI